MITKAQANDDFSGKLTRAVLRSSGEIEIHIAKGQDNRAYVMSVKAAAKFLGQYELGTQMTVRYSVEITPSPVATSGPT